MPDAINGTRAFTTIGAVGALAADALGLIGTKVLWSLVSLDAGTEIIGAYPAVNVVENVSATWSQSSTIGLDQPILQFGKGNLETITFEARVWLKHRGLFGTGILTDDIQAQVDTIRFLARKDPKYGRPHVHFFSIGAQFSQLCVVTSVGRISYDQFVATAGGVLRGASFSISLARYVPYDIDKLAQAESLVTPARTGETYENIAKRVLGDPELGVALRRRNPDRLTLVEGDLVHVPTAPILRREVFPLAPQNPMFGSGDAERANRVAAFKDRSASTLTRVLSTDWGG